MEHSFRVAPKKRDGRRSGRPPEPVLRLSIVGAHPAMVTAAPPAIIIVVVRVKSGTDENPTVMMTNMMVVAPHASSSAKRHWAARVRTAAMTAAVTALYHVHDSAIGLRGIHQLSDRTGHGPRSRQAGAVHEGEATNGNNTLRHSLHDRSSLNPPSH